jgi:DNA-binding response OmpR family regulator
MDVLVVASDAELRQKVQQELAASDWRVAAAATAEEAQAAMTHAHFGAVVLDLELADCCGLDVLRQWRSGGITESVLVLSERGTVEDKINGFNVGADDFLVKPFDLQELVARVRVILRRTAIARKVTLERGGIRLDLLGHRAYFDGTDLNVTRQEFDILHLFMQNPARTLARASIVEEVWPTDHADGNLLDVYMSRLRLKFKAVSDRPVFKTVRGVGYQLI